MSSVQKMLKQAQKMQKEMEKTQNQLAEKVFTFSSNGVTAKARGDFTLAGLEIDPDLLTEPDAELLQDVILVSINGALSKAREEMETKLSSITGGLNMPGML